ncbi:MAG: hypothetical protein RBS43_06425 [Candidatus Cloacimonas sp.]|jgi:hypothetical protein|nr:hypothetical protein [Candidatus Cloacimonas sp.]
MSNFITNTGNASLKTRLSALIKESQDLKFLVGFFYFSGISELIESLKANIELTPLFINVEKYAMQRFSFIKAGRVAAYLFRHIGWRYCCKQINYKGCKT